MTGPAGEAADAAIGVDLGGTKALAAAVVGGSVVATREAHTGRGLGPSQATELVARLVGELEGESGRHRELLAAAPVGVGFPGLVTPSGGTVRSSVILDGWREVPWVEQLESRLRRPVRLDNDVHNAALAETQVRQRDGEPGDLLVVTAGTGIGGAVVLDGRVRPGASGSAGEVGHMSVPGGGRNGSGTGEEARCECGGRGCLHLSASGRGIEADLGAATGSLGELVDRGDPAAIARLWRAAEDLGRVLVDAMRLLDLPLVAVGGGLSRWPPFVPTVLASFREFTAGELASSCRIEPLRAGYEAGAIGAALLASSAPGSPPPRLGRLSQQQR